MALEGELKGLSGTICDYCGTILGLRVQRSAAGYYLGYWCMCSGPYSRETGYYSTKIEAEKALRAWLANGTIPANVRDTRYHPEVRTLANDHPQNDPKRQETTTEEDQGMKRELKKIRA